MIDLSGVLTFKIEKKHSNMHHLKYKVLFLTYWNISMMQINVFYLYLAEH